MNAPVITPAPAASRPGRIDDPSRALPAVARPWLIIAVIAIDLALAIAGAWMLRHGLAASSNPAHPPAAAPPASKAP